MPLWQPLCPDRAVVGLDAATPVAKLGDDEADRRAVPFRVGHNRRDALPAGAADDRPPAAVGEEQ